LSNPRACPVRLRSLIHNTLTYRDLEPTGWPCCATPKRVLRRALTVLQVPRQICRPGRRRLARRATEEESWLPASCANARQTGVARLPRWRLVVSNS